MFRIAVPTLKRLPEYRSKATPMNLEYWFNPVPMATSGGTRKTRMKMGAKKVAPPTPEAIAAVAQGFMTDFPDMVIEMDSLRMMEGIVEYHWTFTGTNTGPGGTGNAVRFSGYEEWTLGEDGSITSSLGHFDETEYNRQLEFGVDGS